MQYEADARALFLEAAGTARELGHSYVGSAHLLLALSRGREAAGQLLRGAGFDPALGIRLVTVLYGTGTPGLPLPQGFSGQVRRILRDAGAEAKHMKRSKIGRLHILLSLLRREKTAARELLCLSSVDTEALFSMAVDHLRWEVKMPERNVKEGVTTKLLEQFSEDLIQKAAAMEPVIGREREIETVIGILSRKNKNNPALIGEPGVGKTAIAEGLAQRMAAGNVPPQLKEKRLVSLNMANLVAGTKYRGNLRSVCGMYLRRSDAVGM